MSDLKERLKEQQFNFDGPEALARIEELDAEVERYIEAYKIAHDQATANGGEANKLRRRVEELEGRLETAVAALQRISANRATKPPGAEWAETYTGGHCAASERYADIADAILSAIQDKTDG